MKINKKLRLFGLLMALMAGGQLVGQDLKMNGFAGEDMSYYFVPCDATPYKEVNLGSDDPAVSDGFCAFSWKVVNAPIGPECSISDKYLCRPKLKVYAIGEYVLEVTRVSKYGYQTESVCINFTSEIKLVSADSKKRCWENGDAVNSTDFDFVTDPPGFESYVQVHENDRIIGRFWNWYGDEEVRFKIWNPGDGTLQDCDVVAPIYVSTGDVFDLSTTVSGKNKNNLPANIKQLQQMVYVLKNAKGKADKFNGVMRLVEKFSPPDMPIRKESKHEWNVSTAINVSCCEDEKVGYLKFAGTYDLYLGVLVQCPLTPPTPKFGLDLMGRLGVGLSGGGEIKLTTPSHFNCYTAEIPLSLYFNSSIGVRGSAFGPDVLSVIGEFYGRLEGNAKITFEPKPNFNIDEVCLLSGIKATVTFVGFNTELFDLSFGKLWLYKNND